jgi:hypothetical protein
MTNKELMTKKFESLEIKVKQLRLILSDHKAQRKDFDNVLNSMDELITEASELSEREMNPKYKR